jgi:hypothetical protein
MDKAELPRLIERRARRATLAPLPEPAGALPRAVLERLSAWAIPEARKFETTVAEVRVREGR